MNQLPSAEITTEWKERLQIGTEKYKKKWADQHRHPKCQQHHFKIGDKVLLKKRKVNKWSTAHEKGNYEITEICGSSIGARRTSDGRTIQRDASKFRLFHEAGNENWRDKPSTPNTREEKETNRYTMKQGKKRLARTKPYTTKERGTPTRGTTKKRTTQTH